MRLLKLLILFGLSLLLLVPCESTFAQLRGRTKVGGAGSARVQSNARSGLGFRNNPIANPAPSLTPSQVLNPRGSLSAGQVLNPKPSLYRPRSGGTLPGASRISATAAVPNQAVRLNDYNTTSDDRGPAGTQSTDAQSQAPQSSTPPMASNLPAGEQILIAVVALDGQIAKVAPNQEWTKRLSLDALRAVPVLSEQPNDQQRLKLAEILKTYQAINKEEQSANVSKLPEFKQTIEAIQQYLSPLDIRLRKKTTASFQQLVSDLMWYKNGAPWVEYLVPSELTTSDGKNPLSKELLEMQLKRYAKISGDPVYKKVSSLPGFNPAYDAIKSLGKTKSP